LTDWRFRVSLYIVGVLAFFDVAVGLCFVGGGSGDGFCKDHAAEHVGIIDRRSCFCRGGVAVAQDRQLGVEFDQWTFRGGWPCREFGDPAFFKYRPGHGDRDPGDPIRDPLYYNSSQGGPIVRFLFIDIIGGHDRSVGLFDLLCREIFRETEYRLPQRADQPVHRLLVPRVYREQRDLVFHLMGDHVGGLLFSDRFRIGP